MHSGHADAALEVAQQAVRAGLAGEDTQGLLLEIAATRGDQAGVDRALAWARGKPAERYLASLAARYAFRNGQIGRGQALYDRAVDLTHDLGLTDFANSLRARQLADLGETALARQILKATREAADDPDYVFVSAELADPQKAESLMSAYQHDYPHDTLEDSLFAPETRAAIALRKGQPEAAAQALQPVSRYELRGYDTPYLRGRIALAAGDGARAAVEFQKILAHSGVEPTSPLLALAQLGLARAERLRGDHAASRQAYQRFIEEWKAADPDEPLLIAAKAELAAEIIG